MAETSIEWVKNADGSQGLTWNPIRGCTRVSPGCGGPGPHGGCYAEGIAARFSGPGQPYEGIAEMRGGKPRWTGKISFGHDLDAPLRRRKPTTYFVNSMSDLFHEGLSVEEIATVYAVCVAAHHLNGHTAQILTKRSARMREILAAPAFWEQVNAEADMHVMDGTDPLARRSTDARATLRDYGPNDPPPGIWLGVSAEDQQRANERVPDLIATPAAIRFVSAEPLIGPIDFSRWTTAPANYLDYCDAVGGPAPKGIAMLNWIIAGGESGPNARAMHPDWARSIRDQCAAAGVAFHFKQWGAWAPELDRDRDDPDWRRDYSHAYSDARPDIAWLNLEGGRGFHGERFHIMRRRGKRAAGRRLDGVEHNGMPVVRS